MAGDQQAALVGQCCFDSGMSKVTLGTGCFIMTNTGSEKSLPKDGLLTTIAYRINGQTSYASEGSIFVAGQAVKWLRDQLGIIESVKDTEKAFAATKGDAGGVSVVPAFTGLGAPHWDPEARGLISGLTLDTSVEQIVVATLQSIALQIADLRFQLADPVAQRPLHHRRDVLQIPPGSGEIAPQGENPGE